MKNHPSASSWIICVVLVLSGCGGMSHNMMTPSLKITTQDAPSGATTVRYNGKNGFTLAAEGGTPPYKWSWAPAPNSDLPPGLALNGNQISGAPQSSGDFRVVVTVTDSGHPAAQTSSTFTVAVDAPLKIVSGTPPNGKFGVGYGPLGTIHLNCYKETRGFHVGLVCIQCNPSIGSCPATRCVNLEYSPCTKTAYGHVGFTLKASGGAAPYYWTAKGLPPDLVIQIPYYGIIRGILARAGTYYVTAIVTDSEPTPRQTEAHYTIKIYP